MNFIRNFRREPKPSPQPDDSEQDQADQQEQAHESDHTVPAPEQTVDLPMNETPGEDELKESLVGEESVTEIFQRKSRKPEAYSSSQEHLWDEFRRLDQLVRAQVVRWLKMIAKTKPEKFWGMVQVSEEEVNAYLCAPYYNPETLPPEVRSGIARYRKAAQDISGEIDARRENTPASLDLRVEILQALFGLSGEERDILLLCLLPELDSRFRRLYGVLMDDASKTSPTVELILQILLPESAGAGRAFFYAQRPLLEHHLLELSGPLAEGDSLALSQARIDPRIADFLLGSDRIDPRLNRVLSLVSSRRDWSELFLAPELVARLEELAEWWTEQRDSEGSGGVLFLHGPYGSNQLEVARAFCTASGTRLLVASVKAGLDSNLNWSDLVNLCYREAGLQGAALFWDGCELVLADPASRHWEILVQAAEDFNGLTFLTSQIAWEPQGTLYSQPFFTIDFPLPSFSLLREIWERYLSVGGVELSPERQTQAAELLANNFLFTPGQVLDAVNSAQALAMLRDPFNPRFTVEDLYEGCRRQSSRKLISFANRIEPRHGLTFDQLILPGPNKRQLYELRDRIRLKSKVYNEMGFAERLFLGKGLIALFAGSSGTGKTLAASLLASDLELDLYKVDLSAVISKYVGETEKNLKQIFSEASGANAILFFDEADALFGKRAEVEKAQDRWANAEINSLLTQLEEYNGVVILASNLSQNIDDAFSRRFQIVVEFPFPDSRARFKILEGLFPDEKTQPSGEQTQPLKAITRPPVSALQVIADQFKLSGGNLKNIVLHAAFLALANPGPEGPAVTLRHLIDATAREYQKMGIPLKKSEFSEAYYQWVVEDILTGLPEEENATLAPC